MSQDLLNKLQENLKPLTHSLNDPETSKAVEGVLIRRVPQLLRIKSNLDRLSSATKSENSAVVTALVSTLLDSVDTCLQNSAPKTAYTKPLN